MARSKKPRTSLRARIMARAGGMRQLVRGMLILLVGLVVAGFALALAVTGVARQRMPQIALTVNPADGAALPAHLDGMLLANKKISPAKIEAQMRTALRSQPLNPRALRLLATAAVQRGQSGRARDLLDAGAGLTRREFITQLWLIEYNAERNEMAQVLANYDAALRTSPTGATVLYPRLARAIRNPEIRAALKPYVDRDVNWMLGFFSYAKSSPSSHAATVDLILETGGPRQAKINQSLRTDLLNQLFDAQRFGDMRRLYLAGPRADPRRVTDAQFTAGDVNQALGPMGWHLLDEADAGASFIANASGSRPALTVYANSATTRPVARKLFFLRPGDYTLRIGLRSISPGEGGGLGWHLRCLDPLAAEPAGRIDNVQRSTTARLTVPTGCAVQLLDILASGGQGQLGMEAVVGDLQLDPV